MFEFKTAVKSKKSSARAGEYKTDHGIIKTPCFVPVGTKATVKGLTPQDLREIGVQILFGNTYHLHLRPGEDLVSDFGGLAKFMNWQGPVSTRSSLGGPTMTDSGGFQVFSLGRRTKQNRTQNNTEDRFSGVPRIVQRGSAISLENNNAEDKEPILVRINNDGVEFRSHIDGSLHMFTPEVSIEIQKKLGADMILAFDECAPHPSTEEYTKEAMDRTHEWGIRSLAAAKNRSNVKNQRSKTGSEYHLWQQGLYGIIQGGIYKDLRQESAKFITEQNFDAIAIGGVSVGEGKKEMRDVLDWVKPFLPENKTRHLLGIGEIDDIFDGVERGMDTFDCVIPTRFGRYGIAFVGHEESEDLPAARLPAGQGKAGKNKFRININKAIYARDKGSLSKNCLCSTCKEYTRGYINHLFRSNELLAYRLVSYHNVYFIVNLVNKIRDAILEDRFEEMKREWFNITS